MQEALRESSLIYTATDRQDGSRSSVAPIWFWYDDESGYLYTTTSPTSWKAKRLAKGSPLHIWVGEDDGPYFIGEAGTDHGPSHHQDGGRSIRRQVFRRLARLLPPPSGAGVLGKDGGLSRAFAPGRVGKPKRSRERRSEEPRFRSQVGRRFHFPSICRTRCGPWGYLFR